MIYWSSSRVEFDSIASYNGETSLILLHSKLKNNNTTTSKHQQNSIMFITTDLTHDNLVRLLFFAIPSANGETSLILLLAKLKTKYRRISKQLYSIDLHSLQIGETTQ